MTAGMSLSAAIAAETFYFSTSGDDANSGLSPAAPKRTLRAALDHMAGGNLLCFKRGDRWYSRSTEWNLSGKSDFTLDAYGDGPRPIVSNLEYISGGWEQAGPDLWRQAVRAGAASGCFVAGQSRLRMNLVSEVTNSDRYALVREGGQSHLYLYHRGGAPGETELLEEGAGSVLRAANLARVMIRNLDFRGGDWIGLRFTAPSSQVVLAQCDVTRMRDYGIVFEAGSVPSAYHDAPAVLDCHVDKIWSRAENTNQSPPGDGIFFDRAVEGGLIRGCTVVDAGHTGIGLAAMSLASHGVRNCVIELNEVFTANSNYCHAFSMAGYEGKCQFNVVRRNYFHDYNVTSHMLGDHNRIYSNVFRNIDVSPTSTKQGWAMDWAPWKTTWTGGDLVVCHDNVIAHNTIYDCEESPLYVTQFSPAVFGPGNVVRNNLFVKWNELDHNRRAAFGVKVEAVASQVPAIESNGFWNGSSADKVISIRGVAQTAVEFGQGNRQLPPAFVNEGGVDPADYRLSDASPYRSGGLPLGDMGEGFVDFEGRPWHPQSPSLGAFQFADAGAPAGNHARLLNLSARGWTGAGEDGMIVGFVLASGTTRQVLVRAVGPGLSKAPFGLDGTLPDPQFLVLGPDSPVKSAIANDNWPASIAGAFAATGAFPLDPGSADAADVAPLDGGAYTVHVSGATSSGTAGVALLEIYEATADGRSGLINLSLRGRAGTGPQTLIAGFVLGAGSPRRVLLRAVGPTLAAPPFNMAGVLDRPELALHGSAGMLAVNRGWSTSPASPEVRAASREAGAFPLLEASSDSALVATLPPGAYTLVVTGVGAATGLALIEIYELP